MELLTTKEINGVALQCYKDATDSSDFWATREQIGQALEYAFPGESIGKIHNRNKERFDKYSRVTQIDLPSGGTQAVTIYNFKGLLEICRYSDKPKANAVMDRLWEIADEIRRTGSYTVNKEQPALPSGALEGAKLIFETAGITGNQLVLAMDKIYKRYLGHSALTSGDVELEAPTKRQLLTPTEIGRELNMTSKKVNLKLADMGYQHKINGKWEPQDPGLPYAVMLDTGKKHNDGTPVRQLKWDSKVIKVIRNINVA